MKIACLVLLAALVAVASSQQRLTVSGNVFKLNNHHVFLSGANLAWINYARDFGNGQWARSKPKIEEQLRLLHQAGGNSMRLWIHIQGETTPKFDNNGYVTAPDNGGTLLDDFKDLLDTAQKYKILLFPTLWNAAVDQDHDHKLDGLIRDPKKLQSYIDKALKPLVTKVKGHRALGGWDILNEPEGMLIPDHKDDEKCYDTQALKNSGTGWAGKKYLLKDVLSFLNHQAAAIKAVDPGALVTVGTNMKISTDKFGMTNHFSDACLRLAGGKQSGVLDFYEIHSYSWQGTFASVSPFLHSNSDYSADKPILVGEFWEKEGGGMNINQLFSYVYNHGYAGAWSWNVVQNPSQRGGVSTIKDKTSNGRIPINI